MESERFFEQAMQGIEQAEVAVLRDISRFPVFGKDFSFPHLTICLNTQGSAKALYDLQEVSFVRNELAVIMPNHILRAISCSEDYRVTILILSGSFVEQLTQLTMSHDHVKYHTTPACLLTEKQAEQAIKMLDVIDMFCRMNTALLPNRHLVLLNLLDVAFELLNTMRREQAQSHPDSHDQLLFNQFCDLLAEHHRRTHNVADYAEMLHLSPRYFSSHLVPKVVGITAGEWIDRYLIMQIKKVLSSRHELTIQQVAFEFGFSESASFCRFFKHATGMTPTEYRQHDSA